MLCKTKIFPLHHTCRRPRDLELNKTSVFQPRTRGGETAKALQEEIETATGINVVSCYIEDRQYRNGLP